MLRRTSFTFGPFLPATALSTLVAFAATTASAQLPAAVGEVQGPVHVATYSLASGSIVPGSVHTLPEWPGGGADAPVSTYANTVVSGFYGLQPTGEEWVDWGTKAGGASGVVSSFVFGYGTTVLDPGAGGPGADVEIALYSATLGGGMLGEEVARYTFTGLPGSSDGTGALWLVTVDLTGPFAVGLWDGPIGIGFTSLDGLTGPLLVPTLGVCGGPADPVNGTEDCYQTWVPAPATAGDYMGNFAFVTPGIASFYLEVFEEDFAVPFTTTFRNGSGVNPSAFSQVGPAAIGATWDTFIDPAFFPAPAVATVVALSATPVPCCVSLFAGELLLLPPALLLDTALGTHSLPIPPNASFAGVFLTSQGVHVDTSLVVTPTNALDLTLGFDPGAVSTVVLVPDGPLLDAPVPSPPADGGELAKSKPPFRETPITVYIRKDVPTAFRDDVEAAFDEWEAKTDVDFTVTVTDEALPEGKGIVVKWNSGQASGAAIGTTDPSVHDKEPKGDCGEDDELESACIQLWAKKSDGNVLTETAIYNVTLHEAGHAICLGHDDGTNPNSCMVDNAKAFKNDGTTIDYTMTKKELDAKEIEIIDAQY